jgi:hypothetical protein
MDALTLTDPFVRIDTLARRVGRLPRRMVEKLIEAVNSARRKAGQARRAACPPE